MSLPSGAPPRVQVECLEALERADLFDLCDAAEAAIKVGGGFGWVDPPPRETLERYWRGVLAMPPRILFVGRLDGVIAGSAQLVCPSANNEAQAHAVSLTTSFVAPWARGHGLARMLVEAAEERARIEGFSVLMLDVRETQTAAIALYRSLGYVEWGVNPVYARVGDSFVSGHYFFKHLREDA